MGEATAKTDPFVGRVINDRFRIEALIARGGMGKVYRAEQTPLGRTVALKILDPSYDGTNDPNFEQRFFLEASVASKLQHPNTVTVFDYGRTPDGIFFIAMEHVDGASLLDVLKSEGQLSAPRVSNIAIQIARSLREAHRLDVIHRDLKPGNVLVTQHGDEEDFVKVLDFGLVKELNQDREVTQAGLFMGSPKYMAPEQIRDEQVDGRTDVYALGVVMFQLLTGRVPYSSDNPVNILVAHIQDAIPEIDAPDVPDTLRALVRECLAKAPDDRPASMDEVILRLKQVGAAMGAALLTSGAYAMAQSGAMPSGSHVTLTGTPSAGFSFTGSMQMPVLTPTAGIPQGPEPQGQPDQDDVGAQASSSRRGRTLGVAVGVAIAAAAAFLWFNEARPDLPTAGDAPAVAAQRSTATSPPASTGAASAGASSATAEAAKATEEAAPAAEAQRFVLLQITSEPSGASIVIDGASQGRTPAQLEWNAPPAGQDQEITITLRRAGFRTAEVRRTMKGERLDVHATLSRTRRAKPARPAPSDKPSIDPW